MLNKKILGSGIIVAALITSIVGIATYNNYINLEDILGDDAGIKFK